jgi:hypothetical protein
LAEENDSRCCRTYSEFSFIQLGCGRGQETGSITYTFGSALYGSGSQQRVNDQNKKKKGKARFEEIPKQGGIGNAMMRNISEIPR